MMQLSGIDHEWIFRSAPPNKRLQRTRHERACFLKLRGRAAQAQRSMLHCSRGHPWKMLAYIIRILSSLLRIALCGATILVCVACNLERSIRAQGANENWQRVYTGDDSIIEINVASLRFEPNQILRVRFRTILSKPQNLEGQAGAKFKSRLETIDFKTTEKRYRLWETSLLDTNSKILRTYAATSIEDWKVLKAGGVMERLANAVRALPPFGAWKVVEYRLADRSPNEAKPSAELERLIGTRVRLQTDRAEVEAKVCNAPVYEEKQATKEELFHQLGIELESIGIKADHAEMINIKCDGNEWMPAQSLLLKVKPDEMLMLWKGVFLVLKRERQWTGDILPPWKRARG
jgi:hypothetical protein